LLAALEVIVGLSGGARARVSPDHADTNVVVQAETVAGNDFK
jgi:hypothetical protein